MELIYIALSFALGGILKGAAGIGAPLIAIPVLTMLYDVQTAVIIFAIPSLVPNVWLGWRLKEHRMKSRLTLRFAIGGAVGMVLGTYLLANLPGDILTLIMALAILAFIAFRLCRPGWVLAKEVGKKMALPTGFLGGILQGSSGLSAPVSITYLNAMRPERKQFVATISLYFAALAIVQIPAMVISGLMDFAKFQQSCLALIPLLVCMPIGALIGRHIPAKVFDKAILALLAVIAIKLLFQALT